MQVQYNSTHQVYIHRYSITVHWRFTYIGTLLQYTGGLHTQVQYTVHCRFKYTGTLLQYTGDLHTQLHYYSTMEVYIHRYTITVHWIWCLHTQVHYHSTLEVYIHRYTITVHWIWCLHTQIHYYSTLDMMFTYTGTLLQYTGGLHTQVHWRFPYTSTLLQYTRGLHTPNISYSLTVHWTFICTLCFTILAYTNGGGAFLIPYLIVLMLIGRPLYFIELRKMEQYS